MSIINTIHYKFTTPRIECKGDGPIRRGP